MGNVLFGDDFGDLGGVGVGLDLVRLSHADLTRDFGRPGRERVTTSVGCRANNDVAK